MPLQGYLGEYLRKLEARKIKTFTLGEVLKAIKPTGDRGRILLIQVLNDNAAFLCTGPKLNAEQPDLTRSIDRTIIEDLVQNRIKHMDVGIHLQFFLVTAIKPPTTE